MDDKRRIREWAYDLWEKEGRPTGRALDHWLEAERRERTAAPAEPLNEGDGNRTAAREFNREQQAFAQSGPVEPQAREAEAALARGDRQGLRKAGRGGGGLTRGDGAAVDRW